MFFLRGDYLQSSQRSNLTKFLTTPKTLLFLLVAAALACSIKGDNLEQGGSTREALSPHLYPVGIDGKYGIIDESGNLKFTMPDDVYSVESFSEGLAVVAKRVPNTHGRWGYIDQTGTVVIDYRLNFAMTFSEGLAAVIVSAQPGSAGGKIVSGTAASPSVKA
jgi:hypothetical protein